MKQGGRKHVGPGTAAEATLDDAVTLAAARRHDEVDGLHLLHALTNGNDRLVCELLAR